MLCKASTGRFVSIFDFLFNFAHFDWNEPEITIIINPRRKTGEGESPLHEWILILVCSPQFDVLASDRALSLPWLRPSIPPIHQTAASPPAAAHGLSSARARRQTLRRAFTGYPRAHRHPSTLYSHARTGARAD